LPFLCAQDFRNPDTRSYYTSSVMSTLTAAYVDGTFTDDVTGLPAEHGSAPGRMGLTAADVADIQRATSVANQQLIDAAVAANKYVWAAFGHQDGVGSGPTPSSCAAWMAPRCTAAYQQLAVTQTFDAAHANASIASFLITRPP
jgi:hypothetical protein